MAANINLRLGVMLLALAPSCLAQETPPPYLDPGAVERILDAAFPSQPEIEKPGDIQITLRFLPSFRPESEIRILIRWGPAPAVITYRRATVSMVHAAMRARVNETVDEKAVAKFMRVEEIRYTEPAPFPGQVLREALKAIADSSAPLAKQMLERLVQLDGTEYRAEISDPPNRISAALMGAEVPYSSDYDLPLVRWMQGLRIQAERHVKRSP